MSSTQVALDGFEVVQTVQDLTNSVRLVTGKRTLVRLYLTASSRVRVRGTLAARHAGGAGAVSIPSVQDVLIDPSNGGNVGLRRCREDIGRSLNFLIPPALLDGSALELSLSKLERVRPDGELTVPDGANLTVQFSPAVPLRVHVIGVRYQIVRRSGAASYEPSPLDYELLRSWLERAYPVAQVVWSQTVVDWAGPQDWPSDDASLATWGKDYVNPFVSALRVQDVDSGTDQRTHYVALASDGGGFMRGWASEIPTRADPSAVASSPAGAPGAGYWDTDGSYADWYAGHELAHTFGRSHPGFCDGNSSDDPGFPYPNGQIANNDGDFVGYDAGDANRAIAPVALPGVAWHDVMTYCDRQWLSAYTYAAIYERLLDEDAMGARPSSLGSGLSPGAGRPTPSGSGPPQELREGIHVVARVDPSAGKGRFHFVTPVGTLTRSDQPSPSAEYEIEMLRDDLEPLRFAAPFRRDACGDAEDSVTGSVDLVIPNDPRATSLRLLRRGELLDSFVPPSQLPALGEVRSATASSGMSAMSTAPGRASRPKITWAPEDSGGVRMFGDPSSGSVRYTVQVSTDDGASWRTVGTGLTRPETTLDPSLLVGNETVQIRVSATDGFKSVVSTQALKTRDL